MRFEELAPSWAARIAVGFSLWVDIFVLILRREFCEKLIAGGFGAKPEP